MDKESIFHRMDLAFKEDRERFFKVADALQFQPKYSEHIGELEELKQVWRDIPQREDYPNFTHPIALPDWFPKVSFASSWEKDVYIENRLREAEEIKKARNTEEFY